ncbi:MAG: hypothetical protein K2P38_01135 [Lachnospiraceae bacterium]|nr:hypothetical protein [Lachnospiraceae bacterium]
MKNTNQKNKAVRGGRSEMQDMEKDVEEKSSAINIDVAMRKLQEVILFLMTGAATGLAAWLYGKTAIEITGVVVLALLGVSGVIFAIEQSQEADSFLFDNKEHLGRFLVLYLLALAGSLVFPLLPAGGWPYLAAFIGLMLFSNQVVGLSSAAVLLLVTCLLYTGNNGNIAFYVYFVGGLAGIVVFSYLNVSFKVGLPILVSLMVQMVCLAVQEVLLVNEQLKLQLFLIPALNLLVSLILLLILLKYFSFSIIYKNRDLFMDINDPECPLLVELKNASKEEYYHAVHTAYLCDRIAKKLKLDDAMVKACGYYHRIGIIKGEVNWENTQFILEENRFPQQVKDVLREYLDSTEQMVSKETIILLFSDTVITSISYLFSKDPQIEIDYPKIINGIFKKRVESGMIDQSNLTFGEFQEMKKILLEERLYYDFLR